MPYHDEGTGAWAWVLMLVLMAVLLGLLVWVLAVYVARREPVAAGRPAGAGPARPPDGPHDILARRLATGEIDEVEYRRRRDALDQ